MDTNIEANDRYFGEFHRKASEIFYIPTLQRPYSWEAKKQVDKLWEDMLENKKPSYYIGSIVSIVAGGTTSKDQIIDGQQRLTTLYLMLAALRDYVISLKEKQSKDIVSEINNFFNKVF